MTRRAPLGVAAFVAGLTAAGGTEATTRRVPQEYPTIQAAVNASAHFDTVLVSPGRYAERIDLGLVTLLSTDGPQATLLSPKDTGVGYVIRGTPIPGWVASARITGFTIEGARTPGSAGIVAGGLHESSGLVIRDCIIRDNDVGVWFEPSGMLTIEASRILDNGDGVVLGRDATRPGPSTDILHTLFAGNEVAVRIPYNWIYRIHHSTIVDNGTGFQVSTLGDFLQCTIHHNIIASNGTDFSGTNYTDTGCNVMHANSQSMLNIDGDNILADPLFCNPSAQDYRVQSGSPALGDEPPCYAVGAFGAGCVPTALEPTSWGRIKGLYR